MATKYKLTDIQAAIRKGNYYTDRRATRDRTNLGYSESDMVDCLLQLTMNNFIKSRDNPTIADIYVVDYPGPTGCVDRLYIKFRMPHGKVIIESFKLR